MAQAAQTAPLILVADDDRHIVELVTLYLEKAGYRVQPAYDGDQAQRFIDEGHPDLAVLDVMMPGPDGFQITRSLRHRGSLPVILLTARTSDIDKVTGLRDGADDYVTKPFHGPELVARVEAVLRRSSARQGEPAPVDRLEAGSLEIDIASRTAVLGGSELSLTPKELDLLIAFARFPDVALDRQHLLEIVWGTHFFSYRTVDVHVGRLREKLQGSDLRIETVWGTGYRLRAGPD